MSIAHTLKRSACHDKDPWMDIDEEAYAVAREFMDFRTDSHGLPYFCPSDIDEMRLFLLLVAAALK